MNYQFIKAFTLKEEIQASVSSVHLLIKITTDLSVEKIKKAPNSPVLDTAKSPKTSPKFKRYRNIVI